MPGLQTGNLLLTQPDGIVQDADFAVAFGHQGLPGLDFTAHQRQVRQGFGAAVGILPQLAVQDFDLLLQLGLAAFLPTRILGRSLQEAQAAQGGQKGESFHRATDFRLASIRSWRSGTWLSVFLATAWFQ